MRLLELINITTSYTQIVIYERSDSIIKDLNKFKGSVCELQSIVNAIEQFKSIMDMEVANICLEKNTMYIQVKYISINAFEIGYEEDEEDNY